MVLVTVVPARHVTSHLASLTRKGKDKYYSTMRIVVVLVLGGVALLGGPTLVR